MKRNRNGYRPCLQTLLHDLMVASLAHSNESVFFEDPANLRARKNSKITQPVSQPELRRPRYESVGRFRPVRQFRKTA